MFDPSFAKLALIACVALVVIGPAQLPHAARTIGTLLGRARRYLNDVKNEVKREIELEEWRNMKMEFEQSAQHIEQTLHTHFNEVDNARPYIQSALHPTALRKRNNWHARQSALPLWYKRINVRNRIYIQSGAARMRRHTSAQQQPIRFF